MLEILVSAVVMILSLTIIKTGPLMKIVSFHPQEHMDQEWDQEDHLNIAKADEDDISPAK